MPIYKQDGKKNGLQKYRVIVSFTDQNGEYKQISRTAYGKEEAKQLEAALLDECKKTTDSRMTVSELADEYLASKKQNVRATTYDKTRRNLNLYILPKLGKYRLDRLTVPLLQKWKSSIGDLDISITTKRNMYKELSALLNYAAKTDRIISNPLLKIGNFRDALFELEAEKLHYYTPEQYLKFADAAKAQAIESGDWRYYVFFSIAFYTGMRKGEINALKWSDLEGNIIHVRRSIAQKLKGDDVETPPKNRSSYRDLQVPAPLLAILSDQRARHQQIPAFSEDFRICGGQAVLRDSTIEHKNQLFAKSAGLPHIRIHDFRHTHASVLINEGISIQEIARRLGHSKVEITWNTYAHLYPREEERAVHILDKIL